MKNLKNLDLCKNNFTEKSLNLILFILPKTKINEIYISENKIELTKIILKTDEKQQQKSSRRVGEKELNILSLFWHQIDILEFQLENNPLNLIEMKILSNIFKYSSLLSLNLSKNEIDDEIVILISEFLPETQIQKLNLKQNKISDKGLQNLIPAIKNSPFLEDLNLESNNIKNGGIKYFIETISQIKLKNLWIENNPFDQIWLINFIPHLIMNDVKYKISNSQISFQQYEMNDKELQSLLNCLEIEKEQKIDSIDFSYNI
jgi:Ran GTPase-activating protein (RanGAP) involved in mRNA processing and transport